MLKGWVVAMFIYMSASTAGLAAVFDHGAWDDLLQRHVSTQDGGRNTVLDYRGMAKDHAELKLYLNQLAQLDRDTFDGWSKEEQLAFLINAYNAWTVELILTRYPDIDSIKDLGGFLRYPWQKPLVNLFGEIHTLDTIEHDWIRGSGRYNDPRIHFAVNCASIGCPALRAEAYWGDRLDGQLQDQTRLFLSDLSRNRFSGDTMNVSPIFKWYREDFNKGWKGISSLTDFFIQYRDSLKMTKADSARLINGEITVRFMDYDWRLNDQKPL